MTKHLNRDVVALRSRKNKPTKKGFTLTEMLVVVMVVAVLAAIAYPLYTKASTKSRAIEAINLLEMVRNKQLQKYAASRAYYTSFDNMGQLTSNKKNEVISGQQLKVKDYTLSLNNVHSCMTATYEKGRTKFSFSSSYEYTGLGCTGDVCSSFGDIVGTAKDVCNCGSKTCTNGYTLNEDTCNCDCYLGCNQGGTCFAPYGGGQTRACSTGCGTQSSTASCSGPVWSGSCWSPTQTLATSMACSSGCGTQTRTCTATCSGGTCGSWNTSACYTKTQTLPTSRSCGNSGTQTRTCTATCSGGSCGAWGTCTGQTCPTSSKPTTSQACGNCGTQTRTVTCDTNTGTWTTTSWGACTGTKTESATCDNDYVGMKTRTCTDNVWGEWDSSGCAVPSRECTSAKPASTQTCGNCGSQTRTVSCDNTTGTWTKSSWSTCSGEGVCAVGATQTCNTSGTQTCSSTCTWGDCSIPNCPSGSTYNTSLSRCCSSTDNGIATTDGGCCVENSSCGSGGICKCIHTDMDCSSSTKPSASQSCGNCGTQTRTVTCDSATYTWITGDWGACTGEGVCAVGATESAACDNGYSGNKTRTCSSSCTWGSWNSSSCSTSCASGYCYSGSACIVGERISGGQTCKKECTSAQPATAQSCGNCGNQSRTVTCDYTTGNWQTGDWGTCTGTGVCAPGATQTCGGGQGVLTCSSSCAWGSCVCNSGYSWNGSTCASNSCDPATKPNYSSKCGCGDLQYTYTCDLSTLTWKVASTQCINTHTCSDPNQTRSCGGGNGTQKCGASCEWSSALACVCNTGYTWNGSTCIAQCTGCTPGETQTIIPSAPYGVAGTKTCTTSCTWQVSCPTNSQWNSGYNSCIARHPIGHETKSWTCGAYVSASTCTLAHCLSTGINGCNVPRQNTACTGAVSCAENAVSRVNYDCTVYPYEVLSVAAVKQANGMYVCDCKYNVYNVSCSYDPNTSY